MATPPQQARSIATEQKMLDAAEELLKGGDSRQVTLENVVKLSGATVGSFYARFGSVEGLFEALKNRYRDVIYQTTIIQGLEKALQQPDLRSSIYQAFKAVIELAHQERKAIVYFLAHPDLDRAEQLEQRKFIVGSMYKILQQHREEIVRKDLCRANENVTRIAYAVWIQVALQEPSEFIGRKTSLASVINTTTEMAYAYLTTE
jgi:AcrR family transcriptional regulator